MTGSMEPPALRQRPVRRPPTPVQLDPKMARWTLEKLRAIEDDDGAVGLADYLHHQILIAAQEDLRA